MKQLVEMYSPDCLTELPLPLFLSEVACGFPSPATDYIEQELDLNKYVVKNPSSTFFARVSGTSMIEEGIYPGDLVVIDKSIQEYHGRLCLCWHEDGFTIKKVEKKNGKLFLIAKNKNFHPIEVKEGAQFGIWGVVTFYFRKMI